jgi:hypothetical protein
MAWLICANKNKKICAEDVLLYGVVVSWKYQERQLGPVAEMSRRDRLIVARHEVPWSHEEK